jgi:Flp pilus assembly protein TadG
MTGRHSSASGNDRGAVLIHVALGVLVLAAFTTFVADYGLMWTARRQAQNSADAAALAGATALAYDAPGNYTNSGAPKQNAYYSSQINAVWGQAPYVDINTHITFPVTPAASCDPDGDGNSNCVRVEVFRNTGSGNALPMLFGHILGISTQNIRASAVALAATANTSDCLKPWAVADKWAEPDASWDPTDTFDPSAGDDYRYQGELGPNDPGTGFRAPPDSPNDLGTRLTLKVGSPHDTINPGWFQALDLGVCGHGASCYRWEIANCATTSPYGIGDDIPKKNGNMDGPTEQGTQDLIDQDPNAEWDPINKRVINSCVGPPYTCSVAGLKQSPRIVSVPIFDLERYLQTGGPGNGTVHITNILGFFVDDLEPSGHGGHENVVGYIVTKKGKFDPTKGGVAPSASFIKTIMLIR